MMPLVEDLKVSMNPLARLVYALVGFVFLGVGIAGFVVPGLPGTVFLLVSLYFFSMSNERMYRWMLTNRYFGEMLSDYKSGLGIPRKIKVVAVTSIVLAVSLSVSLALEGTWTRLVLIAVGLYGIWFVLSRPTREVELARRAAVVG